MTKFYLLISFCLCLALAAHSQNWQPVGPSDFSQPSTETATYTCMALDGAGNPYIAYNDGGLASKATVKKFNSATSTWDLVGTAGFSAGSANYISIAIGANDTAYVSYRDGLAANGNKLTVKKFDGTNWVTVGMDGFSTGGASYTSLAFDGSGAPYVAYNDATDRLTVKKFVAGAWTNVGSTGISVGASTYSSLVFNGGTPYLTYKDGSASKAWLKKFDGAAWVSVDGGTVGFSAGVAGYTSLAFNGSIPYVAFQDGNGGKTTVMKFESGAWSTVGTAGFSAGAATNISLVMKSGTPYVAYTDAGTSPTNRVMIMKYTAGAWVAAGPATITLSTSSYISLVVDGGGTTYIAFQDGGNGNKASVMKFNSAASTWDKLGTNGISDGSAADISMAFSGGTPYVAYRDFSTTPSNKAIVKKFDGTTWTPVGPATGFSAAGTTNTSLAISGGTPYIAYKDVGNSSKSTVMQFNNATSAWDLVGTAGFSAGVVTYTSLAFDGSIPYVAYNDATNGKVTVMRFESGAWTPVGPAAGFSVGAGTYISLVMNGGTPYVAYNDATNLKATVMKFDGAAWIPVGPAAGFSTGATAYTSLAFDGSTPYIAYQDGTGTAKATVMKFNNSTSTWDLVGTAGFSTGGATFTSLAIQAGTPYLAYRDAGNGNKATVMKFDGTSWVAVGTNSSAGTATSTFLTFNGSELFLAYSSNGGGAFAKSITTLTALPLKLLSFKANRSGKTALLDWTTASEENTAYFEVQRSVDGRSFTKIGAVNANNTGGTHNYGFTDATFAGLNVPVAFYRLKMVDVDGNFSYSLIAAVGSAQAQASVTIYPNPVRDVANLVLTAKANEKIAWQIVDASGKMVMNGSYMLMAGKNDLVVATAALSAGMYTLVIDGVSTHSQVKIIKQ